MSRRQLLHSSHEYSFVFAEDLVTELQNVPQIEFVEIVFVYFDAYFKKYREDYIELLLESILSLTKSTTKPVICSNLLYSGWSTTPLSESLGIVGDSLKKRLSLIEDLMAKSNFSFFDTQRIMAEHGKNQVYNFKMGHLYQAPYTKGFLDGLAKHIDDLITKYSIADKKVIILDCDNTLWKGVVGEDGIEGISCDLNQESIVHFHFQQFLVTRKDMGFVLCICSKNNENDVREAFNERRMPLGWDEFVVKKVNWENKDKNIREISEELSLGLESFIFVDDSDFEVLRVKESLPEVKVFKLTGDYNDFLDITSDSVFEKKFITEEDKAKTEQYVQESKRKTVGKESESIEDYIKSLGIQMKIDENPMNDLTRISQLTEKTNQFNFNKVFYSVEALKQQIESDTLRCYTLRVNDKFGDYGLVGVIFVGISKEKIYLENYILSCRILGRRVEFDFLDMVKKSIFEQYGREISEIVFKETAKNVPAQNFYKQIINIL